MAEAQLSVELTAKIDAFRTGFNEAAKVAATVGTTIEGTATKISKSVDDINKVKTTGSKKAFSDIVDSAKSTDASVSVLSRNISENIAAFNKAKVDGFVSSLNTIKPSTQAVSVAVSQMASDIQVAVGGKLVDTTRTASNSVSKDLAKIAAASAKAGQGVQVGSNQAANALTNLGRVAQDAPFGFIGIQNNLNPLLESFQRLREESGSNVGALKALGSSLIGPAGLGVALSLVSAGVLLYQQYTRNANKETKSATDINKDYADTLGAVDRALLKGSQSAETSLVPLKALYDATQNTSLSLTERKKAVDSLQEQYPAYFKNIKDEAILAGDAEAAYRKLTAAIIAKAKASAVEDEIKDNAKLQRTLDKRAENNKKATADARRQQDIQFAVYAKNIERLAALRKKNPIKSLSDITPNPDIRNKGEDGQIGTLKTLNDLTAEGVGIQNQKNIAKNEEIKLSNVLKGIIEANGVDSILPDKTGAIAGTAKDVRTLSDVLKDLNIDLIQADNNFSGTFGDQQKEKVNAYQKAIDDLIKMGFSPANDAILKLKASQKGLFSGDLIDVPGLNTNSIESANKPINIAPVLNLEPVIVGKTELDKALEDLEAKKDQFLSLGNVFGMASTSLSDGFAAIGEGLATGGNVIEAFGQVVINAFGNFLAELGKQSIAEGLFHIAKGVAYSTNPFTAALAAGEFSSGAGLIAAGGLLSIGGGALSSSGKGSNRGSNVNPVTAFANGGIIYGPTLGLMGEYAGAKSDPEVVAPLSKLKSILGQSEDSTLGVAPSMGVNGGNVFNNTTNSYNGGSNQPTINVQAPQPIVIVPSFKMSGRDMYLMFKQEEQRQKRI